MNITPAQASFQRLIEVVAELREKCPWDRKQTLESLRHLTIEETYELADAILKKDYKELPLELGDLMLHIVFYSKIGQEQNLFDINTVITEQIDKLIRRHPHIYGDLQGASEEEIKVNWEKIKAQEKAAAGKVKASVLDGVPESMPSLIKAQRMQEKAALVGFDWDNEEQVWDKVKEEVQEFKEAETPEHREEEMGDLLFALVNYCRFKGINAEDALAKTNQKFKKRFEYIEQQSFDKKKPLEEMSLEEMEEYWQEAKKV
ncbi:UNVERIFIED_CONTAM: hypothetical protein GTU68_020280 [Idotea baltica]|nr:hypothetical protein [Idotea baltica]